MYSLQVRSEEESDVRPDVKPILCLIWYSDPFETTAFFRANIDLNPLSRYM